MISSRLSDAQQSNPLVRRVPRKRKGETNSQWFARVLGREEVAGRVLLVGGTDLTDFRLRVAQSHARMDMLPSFWSHAAIVQGRRSNGIDLLEVRLDPAGGFGNVPANNGLQSARLADYDDPAGFPNLACLAFPVEAEALLGGAEAFRRRRSMSDVGALIVDWLAYIWGVRDAGNPLLKGNGVPSAAFIEDTFALAGLELTPGLSNRSSCPEAIWQSALWWHGFFTSEAAGGGAPPKGVACIDQQAASVRR